MHTQDQVGEHAETCSIGNAQDLEIRGSRQAIVSIVLDQGDATDSKDSEQKPSGGDGGRIVSTVYALILVLCGIAFPVTEALKGLWLQTYYNGTFLIYIYVVAIGFYIYLQLCLIKKQPPINNFKYLSPEHTTITQPAPKKRPKTAGKIKNAGVYIVEGDNLRPAPNRGLNPSMCSENHPETISRLSVPRQRARFHSGNSMTSLNTVNTKVVDPDNWEAIAEYIDLSIMGSVFAHEGTSFYVRVGALVLGIGNLIYLGLELEFQLGDAPYICNKATFGWVYLLRLLFVIVQTFILFKHPKIHVVNQMPVVRMGFTHVIATNLCIWVRTLVNEVINEFHHTAAEQHAHQQREYIANNTTTHLPQLEQATPNMTEYEFCKEYTAMLDEASPYLFPFILEYSLISMATAVIMYADLGCDENEKFAQGIKNFMQLKVPSADATIMQSHNESDRIELLKSHRGMFIGVLLLAGTIISIVLFFFSINKEDDIAKVEAELIYLVSDLVLHSCLLVASIVTLYHLNRLAYIDKPIFVDDILLLISMSGAFLFEMFVIVASATVIKHQDNSYIRILTLVSATVGAIQIVVQVPVVLTGLRRYSATRKDLEEMPGRGAVTFLIIGNVALWIFRTMQVKELELNIEAEFFGKLAWLFIVNLNLPLLLFFRFHSSVCLADIWHMAYKCIFKKLHKPKDGASQHQGGNHQSGFTHRDRDNYSQGRELGTGVDRWADAREDGRSVRGTTVNVEQTNGQQSKV